MKLLKIINATNLFYQPEIIDQCIFNSIWSHLRFAKLHKNNGSKQKL